MNKRRIILGYIFGFIGTIFLSLLVFLLLFKFTISSKTYILKVLERDNYYEKINNEIMEEMDIHLLSSGFTNEIIKDIHTKEDVINDINLFFNNAYEGKITNIDTSKILNKVNDNIDEFFKKNNLLTVNKSELNEFTNSLVNIYSDEVTLYGFVNSIIPKIPKINKVINLGIIVSIIILIITGLILIKIKYRYFSSNIIASGLIILFIRLFIFEKVDIDELLVISEDFSYELRNILTTLQNLSLILGLVLICFGMVLTIVKSYVNFRKINSK